MRRVSSCLALPSVAPARRVAPELDLHLHLQALTPIVGGGVEKHEPDRLDGVRIAGIRGQLRLWLRLILPGSLNDRQRFLIESRLFGRGGSDDDQGGGKSPVALWIEGPQQDRVGDIRPAGYHAFNAERGNFKILPKWSVDERLAYGLFPLQRAKESLPSQPTAAERAQGAPTHPLKLSCAFTLRLRLSWLPHDPADGPARSPQQEQADVELLLLSLWAFLNCGGLGGRTSRGFGALRLLRLQRAGTAWPQEAFFDQIFQPLQTESAARDRLTLVFRRLRERDAHLARAHVWLGPGAPQRPEEIHARLLKSLRDFRQGEGLGRHPTNPSTRRPGISYWPEPMALRLLRGVRGPHAPDRALRPERISFPRAAFGLPIILKFKDQEDAPADSTLGPAQGGADRHGRWPSPVRLRPLACGDQKALPLILVLPDRPDQVRIHGPRAATPTARPRDARPDRAQPVQYQGQGSHEPRNPLAAYLQQGQDGVDAYEAWLRATQGFQRVGGGQ